MIGYTQKEIADKLGMSQQMVSKHWKRARNKSRTFYKRLLAKNPEVKDKVDIQEKIFEMKEREDFFVANNWHIEYEVEPNIEIEMTDEQKELEKQGNYLLGDYPEYGVPWHDGDESDYDEDGFNVT